jgi:hypothetical protein
MAAAPPHFARHWRTATIAALCAAAGSPVWGAVFLGQDTPEESWLLWAAKVAAAALLGSFFLEPVIHHLQARRVPVMSGSKARSFKTLAQAAVAAVSAAVLAEAYRDGILKSFDSFVEWGGTCLIWGLITYAWLRAPATPYVEASDRAEWYAVLGVLGFSLIQTAALVVGFEGSQSFDPRRIDVVFYTTVFRIALWSFIARVGVRVLTGAWPAGLVPRLLVAALTAGALLEGGVALLLWLDPDFARRIFNTTPAIALMIYPFVTAFWCLGLWLATPRELDQVPELRRGLAPRMSHRTRLGLTYGAILIVALGTRMMLSNPTAAYDTTRIDVFMSAESTPDPYGLHNFLTPAFPGQAGTRGYLHAVITVSHERSVRPGSIDVSCRLTKAAGTAVDSVAQRRVEVPDSIARSNARRQTSWAMTFGEPSYPWEAGSYEVACTLPHGVATGDFELR